MKGKEIRMTLWMIGDSATRRLAIKAIIGGERNLKLESTALATSTKMPEFLKPFWEKHGATILQAWVDGMDTPFFGHGSDHDHQKFLEDVIAGIPSHELYETHIASDDDIDYFWYSYGAEGDMFDIQDKYNDKTLYDDFEEINYPNFAASIKYGAVCLAWYKAAKKLGVLKWSVEKLERLQDIYSKVADKMDDDDSPNINLDGKVVGGEDEDEE